MSLKSTPKAPQRPPEEIKIRLKSLQVFPSKSGFNFGQFGLQNGSQNGAQNRSKINVAAGWPPKGRPEAPRAAQRPPGSHFGVIFYQFWTPRGLKIDQKSTKIPNQPSKGRRTNAQHTTTTQRNATHHATPRNATQRNTQRNSQRNTQRNTAFRGPLSTASWPF